MPARHVVVDGSNIATEGRSLPSLDQLDQAVREFRREFADDVITVVVDATFGHRIDPSERPGFDEAVAHNEIVSPPAGAIGRGDAFLLRVAEKVGATVLSNDSFQEFHGEHEWLFNNGRLIGGKPVPGVGWIFTPRTPVRGPKSRDSMREARRTRVGQKDEIKKVRKAIEVATEEAVEPDSPKVKRRRRSRGGAPPADPVNEPLPFIEFVGAHPLGSTVVAEVESFSSHGAFVTAEGVRCYIPLSGLGDPPPRAAKEVLKRGETRSFVLQALDPPRRGIELALAEFAHVSGAPTPETVEEEIKESAARKPAGRKRAGRSRPAGREHDEGPGSSRDEQAPAEPAPKVKKARRGRKAAEEPAAAPAEPLEPVAPAAAEVSGPRKRQARPRAGVARVEPSPPPLPLVPAAPPVLAGDQPGRARAGRKAAAVAPPAIDASTARRRSAATTAEPPPAPAAGKRGARRAPAAAGAALAGAALAGAAPVPDADQPLAPGPASAEKAAAKRAAVKKATVKKVTVKKVTVKAAPAKAPAARAAKAPAKASARKAAATLAPPAAGAAAKTAPAKTAPAKTAPAKASAKTPAKKTPAKKTPAKKTPAKASARKAPARKAPAPE